MKSLHWRVSAVLALMALLYIGHGLHGQDADGTLTQTARTVAEQNAGEPTQGLLWEKLKVNHDGETWIIVARTRVPGGWLLARRNHGPVSFYPDPTHEWGQPQ